MRQHKPDGKCVSAGESVFRPLPACLLTLPRKEETAVDKIFCITDDESHHQRESSDSGPPNFKCLETNRVSTCNI